MAADDELRRLAAENDISAVAGRRAGLGRKIGIVLFGLVGVVAIGLIFAGEREKPKDMLAAKEQFKTVPYEPPQSFREAPPPEPPKEEQIVIPPPPPPPPPQPQPVAIPAPVDDGAEDRRKAEEEAERRKWRRLRSAMVISDESRTTADQEKKKDGEPGTPGKADDDPNRNFWNSISQNEVEIADAKQNRRIDALVAQGTLIRGALETAIQSDLPGMVRATVAEDVYSWDGRRILIPKGSRLVGEYRSGIAQGQTRVMVVWTRMLRSDGVSVSLGSTGTDQLGRTGLDGFVDNHWFKRFGSAILLSVVGGGASYLTGYGNQGYSSYGYGGQSNSQLGADIARQTIADTFSNMASMALANSINIPPTIHVDQGKSIFVFVKRDLNFAALYPDPVQEALKDIRRERGISQKPISR